MKQSWSIIVFAFNERGNIEKFLPAVMSFCSQHLDGRCYEILLVDDGSNDGSGEFMRTFADNHERITLIRKDDRQGIGNALKTGYLNARFENVCAVPGDGQFDVAELVPYLDFEAANFISFYRTRKPGYNRFRAFLSNFNNLINRLFLGIRLRDVNWIKIYKQAQLKGIEIRSASSLIESELSFKLINRGFVPMEVPSNYLVREHGRSKGGSYKTVSKAFREMFVLIFEAIRIRLLR